METCLILVGKLEKMPDVKLFRYNVAPVTLSLKHASHLANNIPVSNYDIIGNTFIGVFLNRTLTLWFMSMYGRGGFVCEISMII